MIYHLLVAAYLSWYRMSLPAVCLWWWLLLRMTVLCSSPMLLITFLGAALTTCYRAGLNDCNVAGGYSFEGLPTWRQFGGCGILRRAVVSVAVPRSYSFALSLIIHVWLQLSLTRHVPFLLRFALSNASSREPSYTHVPRIRNYTSQPSSQFLTIRKILAVCA